MKSNKPKSVLITGAGKGIGLATAETFLKDGWLVLAHHRQPSPSLEILVSEFHDQIFLIQADFSTQDDIDILFERAIKLSRNGIDALINNAAHPGAPESFMDMTSHSFDEVMNVNVKMPLFLSRRFIQHRLSRGGKGSIVNVSSIGVKFGGGKTSLSYSMSKAALELQTQALAKTYAANGVLVNAIRAGVVDTEIHRQMGKDLSARAKMIPLQRIAQAEEIANVLLFMCSEQNSYMTGSVVTVAGGE